jgi:hypothetical protein
MARWTMFGLHILYEYWLNWYSSLIVALLLLRALDLHDDTEITDVCFYVTMMLSSVYIVSSLKKRVIHSKTTEVSLLDNNIKWEVDDP